MAHADTKSALSWADDEIIKHRAAISDLEAYKRVVLAGAPASVAALPSFPENGLSLERNTSPAVNLLPPSLRLSKKRLILRSLASSPNGAATRDVVIDLIANGLSTTTVENTSPQLSSYRADGLLLLSDGRWHITDEGRNFLSSPETK